MHNGDMIDDKLSEAVIVYVGSPGILSTPSGEDAVRSSFGDVADDLVRRIRTILDPLYAADPPLWNGLESQEIYPVLVSLVGSRHKELSQGAVRAVANRYCFDWK